MRISDWSSDVCSSDLIRPAGALSSGPDIRRHLIGTIAMPLSIRPINPRRDDFAAEVTGVDVAAGVSKTVAAEIERSEERRLGKEGVSTCRFRWSPYHNKQTQTYATIRTPLHNN